MVHLLLTIIFLVGCLGSFKSKAFDLSGQYDKKMLEEGFTSAEMLKLKDLKILIVPGVLAESFDSNSGNQIKVGFAFEDGFKEQKKLLEKNKIDYQYLNFDTESSIFKNAQMIIKEIETSSKKVLIYSHSKGGLDTLEAFRQRPDLLARVYGWVSVQSPFWGATVASMMYDNIILRENGKTLFEWMGGDVAGMSGITINEREAYMNRFEVKGTIELIKRKIKFLNYASFIIDEMGIDTPLELFRDLTQSRVGNNDGVVALQSALMASHGLEVDYVIEPAVDHLMTMTKYRADGYDLFQWINHKFSRKLRREYSQQKHTAALFKIIL